MSISLLPTAPSRARPDTYSDEADAFFPALATFRTEANALAAGVNGVAAGGAYTIPYNFSSTTTDSDPGDGFLRLNNATQEAATVLRVDTKSSTGAVFGAVLDTFDDSTSALKGAIRLDKAGDPTKWVIYSVTAIASPSGYRNVTVVPVSSSGANPFTDGDALLLSFQRNGDKGDTGSAGASGFYNMVVLTTTQAWTPPAGKVKAEVTVVDGGGSSCTSTTAGVTTDGGPGGSTSISTIAIDPAVTYTAAIGAGGSGPAAGTTLGSNPGGASSFAGSGISTLTGTSGAVVVPGGRPTPRNNSDYGRGGASLLAPVAISEAGRGYGGGAGGGAANGAPGYAGANGVIIIRY